MEINNGTEIIFRVDVLFCLISNWVLTHIQVITQYQWDQYIIVLFRLRRKRLDGKNYRGINIRFLLKLKMFTKSVITAFGPWILKFQIMEGMH